MELTTLQKVAVELNELLANGFINKIHQPLPREIVLRIRVPTRSEQMLMLSADPKLGRLHLTRLRIPNPPSPPRFCAFLRAHFQGARIVGIECLSDDRVVFIDAVRGQGPDRVRRRLVLELLGRDSNIILVDRSTNKIMECLHRIPEKETGTRVVWPEVEYSPPPKRISSNLPGPTHFQTHPQSHEALSSPPVSKETSHLTSANEQADLFFIPMVDFRLLEALRNQIAGPLKARIRSLERRLQKIDADARRLSALEVRRQDGELLKANLKAVKKGMKEIAIQDWNTDQLRSIALNPALDPVANMNVMFAKAAKGKRGKQIVQQRLADTADEKMAMEDLLFFVEEAASVADLERIAGDFTLVSITRDSGRSKSHAKKPPPGSYLFREFRTPSGKLVLVGKSGKGNDFLLRSKAHPGDLWLHTKGYAGAHVILLQRTDAPLTADEIQFSADVAVCFSKARENGNAEVMLADVKDVRRIAGAVPGRVSVKQYKTIVGKAAEIHTVE